MPGLSTDDDNLRFYTNDIERLRITSSGSLNTFGDNDSLFIGNGAGNASTGIYNTADGAGVLCQNIIGSSNTASGFHALFINTEGNFNTAVGHRADVSSENLTNSTVYGYQAVVNASYNFVFGNGDVVIWGFGAFRLIYYFTADPDKFHFS